jgi:uncharacterized UBP type Zn finger protein
MKDDTPKREYVDILRKTVGESRLEVGQAQISIEKTGTGDRQRPLGKCVAPITVVTREGETIRAEHTTFWIWEEGSNGRRNWVMSGDELVSGEEVREQ